MHLDGSRQLVKLSCDRFIIIVGHHQQLASYHVNSTYFAGAKLISM